MRSRDVRLLLVDDDPSAIQVMSRMLAHYPDQRFATSGADALRLAQEAAPDLIVLDADMPGMTGLEVCDALKADPALAAVPVIVATSHDASALEVAALEHGAADFVTKPLVAAQLTARVRVQLRARALIENAKRALSPVHARSASRGLQPARLLIVDDDVSAIQVLRQSLQGMGDLHFASSGDEALQLARRLSPDLILLDAKMPGLDGFEVCAALKHEEHFAHVPIVFVTRFSDPRNEMRALDLGASDFIAKPYTAAVLQARVRNLLDLKRRTDADLHSTREHWRRLGDARVAAIVGAASDGIVTYNGAGEIVLINATACRMFGVRHVDVIGSDAQMLLGPDLAGAHPQRVALARADGGTLPVEVSLSTVGEGADALTTVMLRDVSDQVLVEAESRARLEAEAGSRMKTMMLSYIAHEIGNPLNAMLGFAQLMERDTAHPQPAAQAQRLRHILAGGAQLQRLMRDLLDIGRFETGNMAVQLRAVRIAPCLEEAVFAASALAAEAGVAVCCAAVPPSAAALADAQRLHQCLLNLLSNAIKYNRPGGWVRLDLQLQDRSVEIRVSDNGLGMDAEQREHLFEPFNRLGRDAARPGFGLGLVITRQLVGAMNGSLRVGSEAGAGSCFTLTLDRAPDAA